MRLGFDPSQPVDVFRVIEEERVWLLFEPLQHLFGFFQREGDSAGVVIHNGHPLSLQRFTAAHEYGHFVLGHEASQDGRAELFGGADVPIQEVEAQAFAAEFLMPLALVNRALDRLSVPREPGELSPVDAYQLSLELGSSYTATITQLKQLNKIGETGYGELGRWQPIAIKAGLGGGSRPANARADVWDVTEARRGVSCSCAWATSCMSACPSCRRRATGGRSTWTRSDRASISWPTSLSRWTCTGRSASALPGSGICGGGRPEPVVGRSMCA
jgi:hypothetical protein